MSALGQKRSHAVQQFLIDHLVGRERTAAGPGLGFLIAARVRIAYPTTLALPPTTDRLRRWPEGRILSNKKLEASKPASPQWCRAASTGWPQRTY